MRIPIRDGSAEQTSLLNVLFVCVHLEQLLDFSPIGRDFGLLSELLEEMKNHVLHRNRQNAEQNEELRVIVKGNERLQDFPRMIHELHSIDIMKQIVMGIAEVQNFKTGVNERSINCILNLQSFDFNAKQSLESSLMRFDHHIF